MSNFTTTCRKISTPNGMLGGTVFQPDSSPRNVTVIMAHGYGAQRTFRLPSYAEQFAQNGYHVLTFDYRGFSDSEGNPRHLVSYKKQLKDWKAVIAAVCGGELELPSERIALWGSSYSGGHVLKLAADLADRQQIQAVISQVPMLNFFSCSRVIPLWDVMKLSVHGSIDLLKGALGMTPHYIPTVSEKGTCALPGPNCHSGYTSLIPEDSDWPNRVAAREGVLALAYAPERTASLVKIPVWLQASTEDQLIPVKLAKRVAKRMEQCELVLVDADHFQIYASPLWEDLVGQQLAFLNQQFDDA